MFLNFHLFYIFALFLSTPAILDLLFNSCSVVECFTIFELFLIRLVFRSAWHYGRCTVGAGVVSLSALFSWNVEAHGNICRRPHRRMRLAFSFRPRAFRGTKSARSRCRQTVFHGQNGRKRQERRSCWSLSARWTASSSFSYSRKVKKKKKRGEKSISVDICCLPQVACLKA